MTGYSATIVSDVMFDNITVDDDMTFRWAAIRSSGMFSTITNTALLDIKLGNGLIASGSSATVLNAGGVIAAGIGAVLTGTSANLVNTGTIDARTIGVKMAGGHDQVLDNLRSIEGDAVGVLASSNFAAIHNADIIDSSSIGILATGKKATIVNSSGIAADGSIHSTGTGVILRGDDGQFINKGSLAGAVGLEVSGHNAVIVNDKSIWGISDHEAAIQLHGTGLTTLTNHGRITAQSDYIIEGGNGDEVIRNDGLLAGRVNLGGGDDVFDNRNGFSGWVDGGAGNDTYFAGARHNAFREEKAHGVDTVVSAFGYALTENIENLALTGTGDVSAAGNDSANVLTGNLGNNEFWGHGGSDIFVFSAKGGNDIVGDFHDGSDRISLTQIPATVTYADIRQAMTETDGNVVIDLSAHKWGFKLTLEHVTLDQMDRSDFIF